MSRASYTVPTGTVVVKTERMSGKVDVSSPALDRQPEVEPQAYVIAQFKFAPSRWQADT